MEQARGIIVKTLTILAGFWIADLAAARVQAGLAAGESIERIMDGMTTMLQHPLALGFDRTSLLCGLGGACAVGLFHLYRWSMKRNWRDGEEYGSARWSTSREMAPYTDNDTRQNLQTDGHRGPEPRRPGHAPQPQHHRDRTDPDPARPPPTSSPTSSRAA